MHEHYTRMVYIMIIISADRKTDIHRFKMTFLISANRLVIELGKKGQSS